MCFIDSVSIERKKERIGKLVSFPNVAVSCASRAITKSSRSHRRSVTSALEIDLFIFLKVKSIILPRKEIKFDQDQGQSMEQVHCFSRNTMVGHKAAFLNRNTYFSIILVMQVMTFTKSLGNILYLSRMKNLYTFS